MKGVRPDDLLRSRRASETPMDRGQAFAMTDEYPLGDHPLRGGPYAGPRHPSGPDDPRLRLAESPVLHAGDVSDRPPRGSRLGLADGHRSHVLGGAQAGLQAARRVPDLPRPPVWW